MVQQLWRYLVKSAHGESMAELAFDVEGAQLDRAWACIDGDGIVVSAKQPRRWGRLLQVQAALSSDGSRVTIQTPDGSACFAGTSAADGELSRWLGAAVTLTRTVPQHARLHRLLSKEAGMQQSWSDGAGPESVTDMAGARPGGRFVDYGAVHVVTLADLEQLRLDGGVEMAVTVPTPRCAIPGAAQPGLDAATGVLRAVGKRRTEIPGFGTAACVGVYAEVLRPGVVRCGELARLASQISAGSWCASSQFGNMVLMADKKLAEYRRKRDPAKTPEPMPSDTPARVSGSSFVVQEHHATALHWDFRLERDGVLVSWAVPKGLPLDPKVNHLAVHTEDHPLEYASFEGRIGKGEYGGGQVTIWDSGSYVEEKWTDREVKVVLTGTRVQGRYVLFHTGGKNWMIHRMDAPPRDDWLPLPQYVDPMLATLGELPAAAQDDNWAYEMKWDGVRALVRVDGGRISLTSRNKIDMTIAYPELRALGESLGTTQVLLDGEIVSFDEHGRPSFGRLQKRMHVGAAAAARKLSVSDPAVLLVFDVLHLDGRSTLKLPYSERREMLEGLQLNGPNWQTPPAFVGSGADAVHVSKEQQLEGVVAKRLASVYSPGRRSPDWIKIKNIRTQEVIVGGWRPGTGRRTDTIGSLLLGLPTPDGLAYVGRVGTGFTDAILADLTSRLHRSARQTTPFLDVPRAEARDAHWATPNMVGEVAFSEWTSDGRLRHPAWRGLRPDKCPEQVVRES